MTCKILLIEDHPLVRAGCRRVLRSTGAVVLEATTGTAALQLSREERPDIIFLDINLPDVNGVDLLARLRAENQSARVIILTMYEDLTLARRLLRHGASGYVTKRDSPESMLRAIDQCNRGAWFISPHLLSGEEAGGSTDTRLSGLSPRDKRIVELLGQGKSLSEIAYELGQSYKTVANVTNMIRHKLGLKSNAALIKFAVERQLGSQPEMNPP